MAVPAHNHRGSSVPGVHREAHTPPPRRATVGATRRGAGAQPWARGTSAQDHLAITHACTGGGGTGASKVRKERGEDTSGGEQSAGTMRLWQELIGCKQALVEQGYRAEEPQGQEDCRQVPKRFCTHITGCWR